MTILNVNSDILTPPSLTLNTFGTMQPAIKSILFKKCSQQFLYGFPYEATISIHAGVQEFSSRRVDSRCICHKNLFFLVLNVFYRSQLVYFKENFNFPWFQRGSINSSSGKDGFQLFPGGGGGGGGVSRCLIIPYLSPYNLCCVFQGGLVSPLDPSMQYLDNLDAVTKVRYLKKLSILNLPEYMVSGKTAIEA